jgi:hypothetical protein
MAIECATVDNFVRMRVRLVRAVRIKFYSISANSISNRDRRQCSAGACARIQHRCIQPGETQPTSDLLGFLIRKRVIAEF